MPQYVVCQSWVVIAGNVLVQGTLTATVGECVGGRSISQALQTMQKLARRWRSLNSPALQVYWPTIIDPALIILNHAA
jgi:hypothetical protein